MTRRDLIWRLAGALAIAGGCLTTRVETGRPGADALLGLLGFALAIAGLVLLIQGKRLPLALRIERSPHRHLPFAIGARRRARNTVETPQR